MFAAVIAEKISLEINSFCKLETLNCICVHTCRYTHTSFTLLPLILLQYFFGWYPWKFHLLPSACYCIYLWPSCGKGPKVIFCL